MTLSDAAREWNERQKRAMEFHQTEGRALHDIERELRELRKLLAALCSHLGVTGTHSPYR